MTTKMNTSLGRREFLHTAAGAVSFGAFFSSVLAVGGVAAAADSSSGRSAELEEVLATMEARGRRFMSVPRAGCQFLHSS